MILKAINTIFGFVVKSIDTISKFTKIRRDIVVHILLGLLIAFVVGVWLGYVDRPFFWAAVASTVAGALKELVWDMWWKKGVPDWWDFIATSLAGILVTAIFYII